eukprot:m.151086 g.151086  ORF g.151086 m.151086 type:complete len:65 (-) comp10151_c0_seq2:21-215(-)
MPTWLIVRPFYHRHHPQPGCFSFVLCMLWPALAIPCRLPEVPFGLRSITVYSATRPLLLFFGMI